MIADWDDAYASAGHIAEADMFPRFWAARAAEHCAARLGKGRAQLDLAYGEDERERLDLFRPDGRSKGLAVFVHGGDWSRFDKSSWSHLSDGSLRRGWTVAVPSYPLAPKARIKDIARAIARAIGFAARLVPGPITLAGHCSGGHLAARMGCLDGPLQEVERRRLARVIAISGVFDLRPLLKARLNEMLRLNEEEAVAESPALLRPLEGLKLGGLGRLRRAAGIPAPERPHRQYLERPRRRDPMRESARPPPLRRDRRPLRSGVGADGCLRSLSGP